jgi:lipoate-protein ligase A
LSYALVLEITAGGPLRNVTAANRFITERNRAAIQSVIRNPKSATQVQGCTDLTLNGLKFSGNAQRRRRHWLLFHGTFLLHFDLALISELLPMPSRQPDYRAARPHEQFLTNLNLPAEAVKAALREAWLANDYPLPPAGAS